MKNKFYTPFYLLLCLSLFSATLGQSAPTGEPKTVRSFLLGFTPMNFDGSAESTKRMADFLKDRAEIVSLYIEQGVPWPEALDGKPFPPALVSKIKEFKQRISPRHKVFLALNSTGFGRSELAGYVGDQEHLPRPGEWASKDFDDPQVIEAYAKYAVRMVDEFQASYVGYGIEINMLAMGKPHTYQKFLVFAKGIYSRMKAERPDVLFFPTFQAEYFHINKARGRDIMRSLMPFSDAVAVSSYPHSDGLTVSSIPPGWFSDIAMVAPEKPFIIAETAFTAEPFEAHAFNRNKKVPATPQMQADYVQWLMKESIRCNAMFVNWFFPEDLDAFWSKAPDAKSRNMLLQWRDVGFLDESLKPRPALAVWDEWLSHPVKRVPAKLNLPQSEDSSSKVNSSKSAGSASSPPSHELRLLKKAEWVMETAKTRAQASEPPKEVIEKMRQLPGLMKANKLKEAEALLDEQIITLGGDLQKIIPLQ